jgi:hypothetical protein
LYGLGDPTAGLSVLGADDGGEGVVR